MDFRLVQKKERDIKIDHRPESVVSTNRQSGVHDMVQEDRQNVGEPLAARGSDGVARVVDLCRKTIK